MRILSVTLSKDEQGQDVPYETFPSSFKHTFLRFSPVYRRYLYRRKQHSNNFLQKDSLLLLCYLAYPVVEMILWFITDSMVWYNNQHVQISRL